MKTQNFYFSLLLFFQLCGALLFIMAFFRQSKEITDKNLEFQKPSHSVKKVVVVLVDCLAADLAQSEDFYFFREKSKVVPDQTLVFLTYEAPPTVTDMRVRALITGNPPPFINIQRNFQVQNLLEDNIIDSMQRQDKSIIVMGDKLWKQLFPNKLKRAYTSDNIFQIDDIKDDDEYSRVSAFKNLLMDDWELMVGKIINNNNYKVHLLGLDHIGHSYTKRNHLMPLKLREYSNFINQVYDKMSNDTMMVVLSDHGMTEGGQHGGETEAETQTMLFGILKGDRIFNNKFSDVLCKQGTKGTDFERSSCQFQTSLLERDDYLRKVDQLDIAPTLSYLLQISIPFTNIGVFIPEFQIIEKIHPKSSTKETLQQLQLNLKQIWTYIQKNQQETGKYHQKILSGWSQKYQQIQDRSQLLSTTEDEQSLSLNIMNLIYEMQIESQFIWNNNDYSNLRASLTLLVLSILLSVQLTRYLHEIRKLEEISIFTSQPTLSVVLDVSFKDCIKLKLIYQAIVILLLLITITSVFGLSIGCVSLIIFLQSYVIYKLIKATRELQDQNSSQQRNDIEKRISLIQRNDIDYRISRVGFYQRSSWQTGFYFGIAIAHGVTSFDTKLYVREIDYLFYIVVASTTIVSILSSIINRGSRREILMQLVGISLTIMGLVSAEQYDTNYSTSMFPPSPYKFYFQYIVQRKLFYIITVPYLLMHGLVFLWINKVSKHVTNNQKGLQINFKIVRVLSHLTFIALQAYIENYNKYEDERQGLMIFYYNPRGCYMLIFVGAIFVIRNLNEYKAKLLPIFILSVILIISRTMSMSVFLSSLLVFSGFKISLSQSVKIYGPLFFIGIQALVVDYFWFMTGQRCMTSELDVAAAYIGFNKFELPRQMITFTWMWVRDYLIFIQKRLAFILLIFYTLALLVDICKSYPTVQGLTKKKVYVNSQKLADKQTVQILYIIFIIQADTQQNLVVFQLMFLIQLMFTALSVYFGASTVPVVTGYFFKLIFDGVFLLGVSALCLWKF